MTTQTPDTLTYGDTFTLPSITHAATGEPVTFRIDDVRDVEEAGAMYEDRARFTPIDPYGNRLSTQLAVKIGRTERDLGSVAGMGARWAYDSLQITCYCATLTDAMNTAVRESLDALTFVLPRFTLEELRATLIASAASTGESLGYLSGHASRAPWTTYQQDANARALRAEAMDLATRQAMHDALTETFAARAAESLKVGA